jgi:hypothetical protein
MNNLQRAGGLSAILFGAIIFAATILISVPIASMPAEAMQTDNAGARLAFASTLSDGQRLMLAFGFGLEMFAALLILPMLLALYARLKSGGETDLLIATGLGAVSVPFFIMEHLPRFSWLGLSSRYAAADAAGHAGLAATYGNAELLGMVAESVFWLFFGVALVIYALAMLRAAFSRWLAVFGLVIALVAIVGAIGSTAVLELGLLEFAALLLFAVWSIAAGIRLYREVPEVRMRPGIVEAA